MAIFNKDVECADAEQLRRIQNERLIKTVERAYNNVPFYKSKFDEMGIKPGDIKSIDDISLLPFTLKTDLRDNYPFGLIAVSCVFMLPAVRQADPPSLHTPKTISISGRVLLPALSPQQAQLTAMSSRSHTDTVFLPAVSGCTTALNISVQ